MNKRQAKKKRLKWIRKLPVIKVRHKYQWYEKPDEAFQKQLDEIAHKFLQRSKENDRIPQDRQPV